MARVKDEMPRPRLCPCPVHNRMQRSPQTPPLYTILLGCRQVLCSACRAAHPDITRGVVVRGDASRMQKNPDRFRGPGLVGQSVRVARGRIHATGRVLAAARCARRGAGAKRTPYSLRLRLRSVSCPFAGVEGVATRHPHRSRPQTPRPRCRRLPRHPRRAWWRPWRPGRHRLRHWRRWPRPSSSEPGSGWWPSR